MNQELIFNELSLEPYPANFEELDKRMKFFIQVLKEAKEKFSFKKLLFCQDLHQYQLLADGFTFTDYLHHKSVSPTTRSLLYGIKKYPFYNDEDEPQVVDYVSNTFLVKKENGEKQKCDGFGIAYLYDKLAVSFFSAAWNSIEISIWLQIENDELEKKVFHISKPEHLTEENKITKWLAENIYDTIKEIGDLGKIYPNYNFENQAFNDLIYWKSHNKELYQKLHSLLKDISINSMVGGLGKTEPLKYKSGFSKRLTQEHRIEYDVAGKEMNKTFTIFSCKGHYGDK